MAKILAPLLGLEKVSIGDNFFMLGGHSLLGTQLIARTRQVFGVELSLRSLFESPTIAELAQKVEERLYVRLAEMSEEDASQFLKEIEAFDRINAE
jgi:acyl carrier protein